jgi:hypothetical protein
VTTPSLPSAESPRYAWAQYYADRGLKVVPARGKHPCVPWKPYQDLWPLADELGQWFDVQYPDANLAAVLEGSSWCVVDCDPASASRLLWDAQIDVAGVPCAQTGGGGLHYWFRQPAGAALADAIRFVADGAEGCDFRAEGVIILPPSVHPVTNTAYAWLVPLPASVADVPELPAALVARLARPARPATPPVVDGPIPEGQREATLCRILGGARRQGAQERELLELARAVNARCVPALEDGALQRVARSIAGYAPEAELDIDALIATIRPKAPAIRFRTAREIASTADPYTLVVPPYLVAGAITEVIGAPKVGKTRLRNYWLRCALTGACSFGHPPSDPTRAVLLTEEPESALMEGLEAAGLKLSDDLQIATLFDVKDASWPEAVAAAVDLAKRTKAGLLMVDTAPALARLEGEEENSAGHALAAMRPLQEAAAQGLSVCLYRHDRKQSGDVARAGRGSSAFTGAVDVVVTISRPREGRDTVRELQALGRFRSIPRRLLVELVSQQPDTYLPLDEDQDDSLDTLKLLAALPAAADGALTVIQLMQHTGLGEGTVRRHLGQAPGVQEIAGSGPKPSRYWLLASAPP